MNDRIPVIGIIGAGTMGAGIAQVAAHAGMDVRLVDVAESLVARGMATITANLDRQVAKGKLDAARRGEIVDRISGSDRLLTLDSADIVIEVVPEVFETKVHVFRKIAEVVGPSVIIASNTSSISISALAGSVSHPSRVAGMHFFNPVPVLSLVEVVRGIETSDETMAMVVSIASRMGKTPVEVRDCPGFVVNRILIPMVNEAIGLLDSGVATASAIDDAMKLGAAHPMGPLALADLIGLDVCLHIMEVLHHDLGDDKYRPAPLLRRMVAAGRLGRKSGRGFHLYTESA